MLDLHAAGGQVLVHSTGHWMNGDPDIRKLHITLARERPSFLCPTEAGSVATSDSSSGAAVPRQPRSRTTAEPPHQQQQQQQPQRVELIQCVRRTLSGLSDARAHPKAAAVPSPLLHPKALSPDCRRVCLGLFRRAAPIDARIGGDSTQRQTDNVASTVSSDKKADEYKEYLDEDEGVAGKVAERAALIKKHKVQVMFCTAIPTSQWCTDRHAVLQARE